MRKFIFKVIVFVLVIGIPFCILNSLYKNTNYWKSANELYELKYYPNRISLLNLGNSHEMRGIRYQKYYDGIANNFATSSQPFYYSYQTLINAEESIEDNAVVIIPISYFDWYYNWEELFTEIPTYNNRYYSYLKPKQMFNFDFDSWFSCGIFPLLTSKENIKYIFDDIDLPSVEPLDEHTPGNIEGTADYKYNSWVNDVMYLGKGKDKIYMKNRKWLIKTIDYCIEKEYTPVLICSPITAQLTSRFSKDFMDDFDLKNQYIKTKYPNVLFLDYSRDEEFCNDITLFNDSDHMNSKGGDQFTKRLISDLVEHNIIDAKMKK